MQSNSLFPNDDRLNRFIESKVVYKASCWDCDDFYIAKTKGSLHDRRTEHFKALTKSCQASAIAWAIVDHIRSKRFQQKRPIASRDLNSHDCLTS